ncbi:MAG: O-antigen ligase family protein [Chloroflexi bacterium]|nr:O-antigen ligase family protein [Chloroflexota bacterium]
MYDQPRLLGTWTIRERWAKPGLVLLALVFGIAFGAFATALNPLYLAAGFVGLAVGAVILMRTQIGLLGFIAVAYLLPYAVIPLPIGSVKLTFLDATLTVLLLIWVARLLTNPKEQLRVSRPGVIVLLFILLAVVSFTAGTAYYVSPETTRLYLKLLNSILFFFTILNCVRSSKQLEQLVCGVVLAGAVAAAIGLALYVLPAGLATQALTSLRPLGYYPGSSDVIRYIADTKTLRAISTSVDPNVLGAILMVSATLSASQLLSPMPLVARKWLVPAFGITFVCLLVTFSRGSWMGFIVAMLFVATVKYRKLWLVFALIGIVLYLGIAPVDLPFIGHLESGFAARDKAAAMRLGEYKDAWRLISEFPWFGVGFGSAPAVDLYVGVSSIYLLMAEQMGLVGAAVFILAMVFLFWQGLGTLMRAQNPAYQATLLGLLAAVVAALVAGIFDHHFFNLRFPHVVALLWMLAGMVTVGGWLVEKGEVS